MCGPNGDRMSNKKNAELLAENDNLRLRLEEAEETLRAIGSGEVDAFVVSGADGDQQIFTLKGADQPYRALVESMSEGAATLSADGTILYCNKRLAETAECPQESLVGSSLGSYIAATNQPMYSAMLHECTLKHMTHEMTIMTGTGKAVPVFFSCAHNSADNTALSVVITDLTQQKRNAAILASENFATSIVEQASAAIIVCDKKGQIIRASHSAHHLCGTNPLLKMFSKLFRLTCAQSDKLFSLSAHMRQDSLDNLEVIFKRNDGQIFNLLLNATNLKSAQNTDIGSIVTLTDITGRKQMENALQHHTRELEASLAEKEVLLKEIHHRVKNNLQVISSLVSLQADGSKDEAVCQVLKDVTYRLRSMALVHENLYLSSDLAHIDFAEYTRGLLSYLWLAHGAFAADVRMTLDLGPVSLLVDTAVTCGLILNELAVNSLKHAFHGRSDGEVKVSLHCGADRRISLCVTDNGVGLPAGFDWRQTQSLGLRLVQMLSRQLDATAEVSSGNGTTFEIVFENPASSPS
jgi:PAS domain S-box-containing protein